MLRAILVAVFVLGVASDRSAAQPPAQTSSARPPAGRASLDEMDALPPNVLVDMLDTYAIVQGQQELSIPDDKYGTFAARLRKLQEIRRRTQRERTRMVRELNRLAGPQAALPLEENAIRAQLKTLRDHDERATAEIRQAYDMLDEVLDVRQQARLRVFEERMEVRKLDLLVRARERAAGRANRR
jgi:hypothetical protein